jgi:quercetin dioxygenase-like cupin family protein
VVNRVFVDAPIERESGSELALTPVVLAAGGSRRIVNVADDCLAFVAGGAGELRLGGDVHAVGSGDAVLVPPGEAAELVAGADGLHAVVTTVGPYVDRHAPIGAREVVVATEQVEGGSATGKRSFQVLFGPHNGSTRATLFVGHIPPGRAPWHYHLYDEIVWVSEGPGQLHLEGGVEELGPGAAFRLHPREVHIVENAGESEMTVLGLFTPAGSPSAAYLPAGSEQPYA